MPSSIKDYRQMMEKPWGKMFYDMLFLQLDTFCNADSFLNEHPLNILDFGAGFCVTASHYATHHHVTAIEPSEEMLAFQLPGNKNYDCIHGGMEKLSEYKDNTFDLVLCHNVLEYVADREQVLQELTRVLKKDGTLSIVKHNLTGRIIASAVFSDDPGAALDLLGSGDGEANMFGRRDTYPNDFLTELGGRLGLTLKDWFGLRTFFALSSNNEVKFSDKWYENMLTLEMKTCQLDEYRNISFFHHLLFRKKK